MKQLEVLVICEDTDARNALLKVLSEKSIGCVVVETGLCTAEMQMIQGAHVNLESKEDMLNGLADRIVNYELTAPMEDFCKTKEEKGQA